MIETAIAMIRCRKALSAKTLVIIIAAIVLLILMLTLVSKMTHEVTKP